MNAYLGEIAALLTSIFFAASSTFFTAAGRRVGALVLNRTRLVFAMLFLVLMHLLLRIPLPLAAGGERYFWLSISGIIGLVLGDIFLFQCYILIGPRLGMLMMSMAPVLSTTLAWIFLGERLRFTQVAGILLTVGGIAWVVAEKNGSAQDDAVRRKLGVGLLMGLGAAAGQALGLITAKPGLAGDFPALSGTLIRMTAAAIMLWGYTLLRGQVGDTLRQLNADRRALPLIMGGALVGPTLGVTLSLVAIQNTAVGVASTLMALSPVFLLPVGYFWLKERFGWQAVAGTLLAMLGVSVLFLA